MVATPQTNEAEAESLRILRGFRDEFPRFAATCLKISIKKGGLVPLNLNEVQREVHARLEQQLQETGRVRALILKCRQPGVSTLVEGRFYWKVTQLEGVTAFILTHDQAATDNLFSITSRFHAHCPDVVKVSTSKANAKELFFDGLESSFKVGTAGTKGVGRSQTIHFFHGSEVAHWPNAGDHMDGILQAVPDEDGTEIILESTAVGVGGLFYSMCKAAERGESEYQLIFVSWFANKAYRKTPPEGWQAPPNFREYGDIYALDPAQLYWAYTKNQVMASAEGQPPENVVWVFRQEYPATAAEAFQAGGQNTFIASEAVMKARKNRVEIDPRTPIVLGVDPAGAGRDRTRILDRQGRRLGGNEDLEMKGATTMEIVGRIVIICQTFKIRVIFIDITGGLGAGVCDRLVELGWPAWGINFSQRASEPAKYANKRAEMWDKSRLWFDDPHGVEIPDDDVLHAELIAPLWGPGKTRYDSNGHLQIEAKDHIIARLKFSPDGGDAMGLTFAFEVPIEDFEDFDYHHEDEWRSNEDRDVTTGY